MSKFSKKENRKARHLRVRKNLVVLLTNQD